MTRVTSRLVPNGTRESNSVGSSVVFKLASRVIWTTPDKVAAKAKGVMLTASLLSAKNVFARVATVWARPNALQCGPSSRCRHDGVAVPAFPHPGLVPAKGERRVALAGLLARGSSQKTGLPGCNTSGCRGLPLAAYSCGYSQGSHGEPHALFPINPLGTSA